MQEVDAERRVQQLRGIQVDPLPVPALEAGTRGRSREDVPGRERKRRRIAGEDDTDRDIRFAQENNALVPKNEMQMKSQKSSDAPITDQSGHINLFPVDASKSKGSKNAESEAEKAKKQREYEDQYTMRFSNAAGFKQAVGQKPWYHTLGTPDANEAVMPSKDVWGNDDPRRKAREQSRIAADDPLAAIKKGVAGVREVEKERQRWKEEKDREIKELAEIDSRRARREKKRRIRQREDDELEGFSLDLPLEGRASRRHYGASRDHSPRHHRHRSRSKEHRRERSRQHRNKDLKEDKPGWEVGPGGRYSSQFAQV